MHERGQGPGEGGGFGGRGQSSVTIHLEEYWIQVHSTILINLEGGGGGG